MKIGNIQIKNKVFLAPMAGITDMAFRLLCKEMGAGLVYSEMVSAKGLYYRDYKTKNLMRVHPRERPLALQIFGSEPDIMAYVVTNQLNSLNEVDIIDINMGCPTPKIVKNGDGSALLKNPQMVERIIREVVKASKKPVTVKIRIGWDESCINAVEIGKIAEASGASGLAIHGRTRSQFYSGHADWDSIRRVKEKISIPIIGNGDIFTPDDGKAMLEVTGCDAIMIGRGCRGNPWLLQQTIALIEQGEILPHPSNRERIEMVIRHLKLLMEFKGEGTAVKEIRKHVGWYIKGLKYATEVRQKINQIHSQRELMEVLQDYQIKLRN